MFGYVKPRKDMLRVWEWEAYQGAYCGLCHVLGKRHGLVARMFLSYDFALLAMLLTPTEERPVLKKQRCPSKLWCRKKACCVSSEGMDVAADHSVILSYWKLKDTVIDGGFWQRQGARILCQLLKSAYKRSVQARPNFDQLVEGCLTELQTLEGEQCPSIDRVADTFARILKGAAPKTGDTMQDRAMEELLYHVGRWIYLVDGWDDLEGDIQDGNYNPYLLRYPEDTKNHSADVRLTLLHSRNLASSALSLLSLGSWSGVVENIIYLGLPSMEERVFTTEKPQGVKGLCNR